MKKRFDSPAALTLYLLDLKYLPRWGVLLLDLVLCFISLILSFALGSKIFEYGYAELPLPVWSQVLIVLAVQTICFAIFRTYSGIIRYSTFTDVLNVLKSVSTTSIILIAVNYLYVAAAYEKPFFTTVLVIYFFVASVLLFCWILCYALYHSSSALLWAARSLSTDTPNCLCLCGHRCLSYWLCRPSALPSSAPIQV